jgi:hypothetical protein
MPPNIATIIEKGHPFKRHAPITSLNRKIAIFGGKACFIVKNFIFTVYTVRRIILLFFFVFFLCY